VKAEDYLTNHSKNPVLVTESTTLRELIEKLQGHHRAIIVRSLLCPLSYDVLSP